MRVSFKKTDHVNNVSLLVHAVCQSRGQDPRIALKLKNMVEENKHARSVKADYRSVDMGKLRPHGFY